MVSLGSSCSSAQAPTEGKPEKIRWNASVGEMWELPLLGLPDDKKLDFDIWYNPENNLIIRVSYSKMGNWEYNLKNFE